MSINQLATVNTLRPSSFAENAQSLTTRSNIVDGNNSQPEVLPVTASEKQVRQAVEQVQQVTQNINHNLQFSIDEDTGKTVIKVMDTQTQEVIRQIPSEEVITIARTMDKLQGLLFNEEA